MDHLFLFEFSYEQYTFGEYVLHFDTFSVTFCRYLHDVIYITGFIQISSILSDKFWYIYLVVSLISYVNLEKELISDKGIKKLLKHVKILYKMNNILPSKCRSKKN